MTTNIHGGSTISGFFVLYYTMYVQTSGEELANSRKKKPLKIDNSKGIARTEIIKSVKMHELG